MTKEFQISDFRFQIVNRRIFKRAKFLTLHVLLFTLFFTCSDVPEEDSVKVDKQYPDQESWGSEIVLTKEGKKRAVIDAGHLVKYNDRAVISMDENVDVDFFDVHETHLSHLKSEEAKVNERTNDLVASGNVVVFSDSGVTLYTEELKWDHKREKIISDVFIKLVTEKDTLTGIGFVSDSNLENWVIHNPSGVTNRGLKK